MTLTILVFIHATSKAPVTTSVALVPTSFLLLLVRHLLLVLHEVTSKHNPLCLDTKAKDNFCRFLRFLVVLSVFRLTVRLYLISRSISTFSHFLEYRSPVHFFDGSVLSLLLGGFFNSSLAHVNISHASSNKCHATRNKKLLETSASLLVTSATLLGTRSY